MKTDNIYRRALQQGDAIRYWHYSDIASERYDVPDVPMQGDMDPFFFLSKKKNFIPHTYPCRVDFQQRYLEKKPQPFAAFEPTRWWFPFGSDRVDLSGFWFRPTRIGAWAQTWLETENAGDITLRFTTCGGGILRVNDEDVAWSAAYQRNLENTIEVTVSLKPGLNDVRVWFDDLAERDIRFFFQLDYMAGIPVNVALASPISAPGVAEMEALLEGVSFECSAYSHGDINLCFPAPASVPLTIACRVLGDFISLDNPIELETELRPGQQVARIANTAQLPADFRNFVITLSSGEFHISRTLGVEICHATAQQIVPETLSARIAEALQTVATQGEYSSVKALARLACGMTDEETHAMLEGVLPSVLDCHDCADFTLVPLLWCRIAWGDAIAPTTREKIDAAILHFRYWMDEPGNDVQWYFSENHALLFHTAAYLAGSFFPEATFVRANRSGCEQAAAGKQRVLDWLTHFESCEMAEWNSAPYFPVDLKGLTALAALSPDADIAARSRRAIQRLIEQIARSCHQGILTASQGRSYEHTLRAGRSLELAAISRLLWGKGNYGCRFHALPQLALLLRDHGLTLDPALAEVAMWQKPTAQEWCFAQGANRIAKLYHYKTRHVAMGSIAGYRWGEWGYQETPLHLRMGDIPEAQVWINHPGETIHGGFGRPSYWGGCGTLPRVQQYRGLAVLTFTPHEGQPTFTHAWLPQHIFSDVRISAERIALQSGAGMALLFGSHPFHIVETGPTRHCEVQQHGKQTTWLVRLNDTDDIHSLDDFTQTFANLTVQHEADDALTVLDPVYGEVRFLPDGRVIAQGRTLDPNAWSVAGTHCELTL